MVLLAAEAAPKLCSLRAPGRTALPRGQTAPPRSKDSGQDVNVKAEGSKGSSSSRIRRTVQAADEQQRRSAVIGGDITKSSKLEQKFKKLGLADFFDGQGQRKYDSLSLSFAAKQHPDIGGNFGSIS